MTESASTGTVIGTVVASDDDGIASMAIIDGDIDGVFAIDDGGQLTVADPTTLDAATTPSYTLTVEATDVSGSTGRGTVVVDVLSADPTVPAEGMVLRLVADDALTDGAGVVSWPDSSGTGNDLAPTAGAPEVQPAALGGHDVVAFDGIDDALGRTGFTAAPTGASDRTVLMVVRYDSAGWGGLSWGTNSNNRTFGVGVASNPGNLAVQGWGKANDYDTGARGTGQGWMIQRVVVSANQGTVARDGTAIGSFTHQYKTTNSRIRLGVEIDDSPSVAMSVAEAIIYNRSLTASELDQAETYLAQRYSIDSGAQATS